MATPPEHRIIEQLYEVASTPELYDDFMRSLQQDVDIRHTGADLSRSNVLQSHLNRATALVDVISPWRRDADTKLHHQLALRMQAMLAVNSSGDIVEANNAARIAYDLELDSTVNDLPLCVEERASLLYRVKEVINRGNGANSIGDVHRLTNSYSGRPMLVTLEFFASEKISEPLAIVKTGDIGWPSHLGPILKGLFNLSRAEVEVMQLMVAGDKVEEIARRRCSSVPTVRSQLSSVYSKTDTKTQTDCIRMVFGLALMHDNEEGEEVAARIQSESNVVCYPTEEQRHLFHVKGGRQIDYSLFGATEGPVVLFYHCQVFGDVWFKEAVDEARRAGLRILAPLRPGYGRSSLYDGTYSDPGVFAADVQELLDHENIEELVVLCVSSGLIHGLALARCEPTRVKAVIATHPILPVLTDADLEGTNGYNYLVPHTRLHFPSAVKFLCKAGFAFVSKSGVETFIKAILRSSPRDVEWATRPDIFPVIEQGRLVHEPQGYVGNFGDLNNSEDWTSLLINCPVPVRLVIGEHDRNVPWAAAKRWDADLAHVVLHTMPDSGYLVHHQHYSTIIKWITSDLQLS